MSVDTTPDKVSLDLTKYYPGPKPVGIDAEEAQKRMALANEDFLQNMGYKNIENVRQGKYFEIEIDEKNLKKGEEKVEEMCKKLLANLVIEDYQII